MAARTQDRKVGTHLLISPDLQESGRLLAYVRNESAAEVWRGALRAYIPVLEKQHDNHIQRLRKALRHMGVPVAGVSDAVQALIDAKIPVSELYDYETGEPKDRFPVEVPGLKVYPEK